MGHEVGRRLFLAGAASVVAAPLIAACARSVPWADASGRLRIATGNPGAVFDRYGAALAREVGVVMPEVSSSVVISGGSVGNVEHLLAGTADVGFCLGDAARLAHDGAPPFTAPTGVVAIARLYDSFLQVVVPRDSPIVAVRDLAGRRLASGQVGSGTKLVVERCLRAAGLTDGDTEQLGLSLEDSTAALERGEVDALAFVSGFPVAALVDLGRRMPLRAIDLGDLVASLASDFAGQYVAGPFPAGPYGLPEAVETVSITTYMLATPQLADDVAHGFASVIFDRQDVLSRTVPDIRQPTAAAGIFTQPIPLHPGALRYFQERDERAE
ncbi:TAXI family TRAP transporter solute-binding subunit [Aeromicrobium alkaliterrae]|uniref:TAXI family TRAP transporter solute-binding subunit n=1 Tax=Aeromicrobium alkaliterrae TaxID=302168 RepID=A0ABP4VT95_9ACTN